MHYLGTILGCILGYLIGSICWSIVIVRIRRGIDIRTVGSHNAGATNTYRVLGGGWALLVCFLDAVKVPTAALLTFCLSLIPSSLFSETSYLIPAVFVLIGHCWPIWFQFRGGKAVACFIGLLFIVNIWYLFIFLIVWWIAVAFSKRVSVASIIAVAFVILLVWMPWLHGINTFAWHWNSAYNFWIEGAPKWGWQNQWLRFNWMNYMHKIAFDSTVSNGLVLHHHSVQELTNSWLSTNPDATHQSLYGMARWSDTYNSTMIPLVKDEKRFNIGYAEGVLEMAICMVVSIVIILLKHTPNVKRIVAHTEPETFKHMTPKEKAELHKLQHQPMPTREERARLKDLEEKQKLELKKVKLQEKIDRVNADIARREAKHQKHKNK